MICFYHETSSGNVYNELSFTNQHEVGRFLSKIDDTNGQCMRIIPETVKVYYTDISEFNQGCVDGIKEKYNTYMENQ